MLKALLHGKAGRVEHSGQDSIRWVTLFKQREDLMTAAVFGRFAYLSSETQASLLRSWFQCEDDFSEFENIEFWPRYQLGDGESERTVEPDILLRFKSCNLLVEVKPPEGGNQYYQQWNRQIAAFLQSDDQSDLPLYFLAVGRIESRDALRWGKLLQEDFLRLSRVGAIKWQPVTNSVLQLIQLGEISYQDQRILEDMLEAFQLYGLKASQMSWVDLKQSSLLREFHMNTGSLVAHFCDWQSTTNRQTHWVDFGEAVAELPHLDMELIQQWKN